MLKSLITGIREALGRPGKIKALETPQSDVPEEGAGSAQRAMVARIQRQLAEHPSRGLTPERLYALLEAAEAGDLAGQHALFADMEEKDPQIQSDLGKRKQAAAELEWQIVAPDGASRAEKKAAAQATEVFSALEVEDLIIDLGDAIGHGWACLELPWVRDGQIRTIEQPVWRPHTWFQTPPEQLDELRLRDGTRDGEPLWPLGWVKHLHRSKSGYLSRLGLHRSLVWPYLFQQYALGDLAELLEILGIPARLGKYPSTATGPEKATLLKAVTELGHAAAGIIPEGMAIEYLEAAKADGATHEVMLRWCERAKSKAILGGTLTTGEGQTSGSYAQAQVHERGLGSLVAADARQYASSIRRDILWPMAALNYGIDDLQRSPRWYLDLGDTEDYKLLAESLPVFVDLGAKVPLWWLHEKTRIPRAGKGEEALQRLAAPSARPADQETNAEDRDPLTARLAEEIAARSARPASDPSAEVDPMTERLAREARPAVEGMLDPLRAMLARAESLPELAAMIEGAWGEVDERPLAEIMTRAGLAAELGGMAEVADEDAAP